MIKTVEIESLLAWVYREELPKRQADPTWASMFSSATWRLGCRIDHASSGEYAPVAAGPPHPDALLVDHAIRGLEPMTLIWEEVCDVVMGGLADPVRTHPALQRMEFSPAGLIITHAQIGMRPLWDIGELAVKPLGSQPRVMWLDAEGNETTGSKRGGYYSPGACCPIRYEPPLEEIAAARAEYFVWHQSLMHVTRLVSTLNLAEHRSSPPSAAPFPWITGETDKRNIVNDISPVSKNVNHDRKLTLIPPRGLTTLGPSRPPRYPVRRLLSAPRKSDIG